jgi:hypothetical protein
MKKKEGDHERDFGSQRSEPRKRSGEILRKVGMEKIKLLLELWTAS